MNKHLEDLKSKDYQKTQLEYLLLHPEIKDVYFINILDGDESFRHISEFQFLLSKTKYNSIKDYIFVGNMEDFSIHFSQYSINN